METSKRKPRWLLAAAATLFVLILAACQAGESTPEATGPTAGPTAAAVETGAPAPTPTLYLLEGAVTTSSGLQYLEEESGSGESPKAGELITMHYTANLTDGTEIANSYLQGPPVVTLWGDNRLLPGWEEAVGMMKPGGKATVVLPAELAFGSDSSGGIPPNSQIIMEVELIAVEPAPVPTQVAAEEMTTSSTGLQYYDITTGEGAEAVKNSTVMTNYTVWVKTDEGYSYIDRSVEGSPLSFVLGRGDTVFPGWEEGTTGMKVGGKRLLVIPPELGLGSMSSSLIPANSTLVMEVELTDVKEPQVAAEVDEDDYTATESGLKYYDLVPGTGATPQPGQTVVVHYTGWLEDGTQFDSSIDRGQPFSFVLGAGNVIEGWDEGVSTMKVGGKRQLVIPAELGYKDQGAVAVIPPGATLIFEVELLEIQE